MADTQSTNPHKAITYTPHNNPKIRKATQQFQTNISDAAVEHKNVTSSQIRIFKIYFVHAWSLVEVKVMWC